MRKLLFVLLLVSASMLPAAAATISAGDLIKGPTDAVYYFGQDGKRYVFPNFKTYITWYPDFSSVKTIGSSDIPVGELT